MNSIAIIIGIGSYNDIGLIRSCGEAKMKSIYLIHRDSIVVPIYKSKYVIEHNFIDLTNLNDIFKHYELKYPETKFLVLPASDEAVVAVDNLNQKFSNLFITPYAQADIEHLMDKKEMGLMAKDTGLRVPSTGIIEFNQKVEVPLYLFPIILKPIQSTKGGKSDICICHDDGELSTAINSLKSKGYSNILYQQYLHDSDSKEIGITGVSYPDGSVEIHGYIDKIRNRSNINNFGVYHPNQNFDVIPVLKKYIQKTGYVGIFDTDFILYRGELYFIECNFRNGAYGYCVTKGGFNMPQRFASANKLIKTSSIKRLKDVIFMEERTDILNVLDKSMGLFKWLMDVIKTDVFLWWNWKDPKPMLRIPHFLKAKFK